MSKIKKKLYVWRWSLQQEVLLLESSDISICSA